MRSYKIYDGLHLSAVLRRIAEHRPQRPDRDKTIRAASCRIPVNRQQRDHDPAIQLSNNIACDIKQQWVNGAFSGISVYGELHG